MLIVRDIEEAEGLFLKKTYLWNNKKQVVQKEYQHDGMYVQRNFFNYNYFQTIAKKMQTYSII